jgi:GDP-mannose transporter
MPAAAGKAAAKQALARQPQPPAPSASASARSRLQTTSILVLYCVSGTLLTLANKLAVRVFPHPNAIATVQNAAAVVMLRCLACISPATVGALPPLTWSVLGQWLPLTALFVGMLVSSLLALMHVSAVTLIVIRNLTSLTVAALEWAVLGRALSWGGAGALGGMLLGASLYGLHDATFSAAGYTWLAVNLATTSAYQVLVKRVVSSDAAKDMGPFGFSYLNNLLSLPMLALISVAAGEVTAMLAGARHLDSAGAAVLALSGALGFCLSVSAFKLNTMIAATSMMVANNVNKVWGWCRGGRKREGQGCVRCVAHHALSSPSIQFLVIILSELFVQRTLDALATAGTFTVLLFGWAYARSRKRERE